MKWEYEIQHCPDFIADFGGLRPGVAKALKARGEAGWELVGCASTPDGPLHGCRATFIFKRPITELNK